MAQVRKYIVGEARRIIGKIIITAQLSHVGVKALTNKEEKGSAEVECRRRQERRSEKAGIDIDLGLRRGRSESRRAVVKLAGHGRWGRPIIDTISAARQLGEKVNWALGQSMRVNESRKARSKEIRL